MADRRVIILGFDGLDPRLCRRWMEEGVLPNLSRLATAGSFREMATTIPCQSPVAWRTFATGLNPGGHGIFDFLRRQPDSYLPIPSTVEVGQMDILKEDWQRWGVSGTAALAAGAAALAVSSKFNLSRRQFLSACVGLGMAAVTSSVLSSWVPREVPQPVNRTGGMPFWKYLGEKGMRTRALWVPVEFPARSYPNCKVLSGLGVPDVQGTNGSYTVYSNMSNTDEVNTEMGGRREYLEFRDNRAESFAYGPPNPLESGSERLRCPLIMEHNEEELIISIGSQTVNLSPGRWTDWLDFEFTVSPLASIKGKGRFYLLSLGKETKVYLSAIHFPADNLPPNISLSSPSGYAAEIHERYGEYKTLGWPTDTWAYTEGALPQEAYLDDYRSVMEKQKEIALGELSRNDWDCFLAIFTPTDQIQHILWDSKGDDLPGKDNLGSLKQAYADVDSFVGRVMEKYGDASLMVMSDHGFHSFNKSVNINTWLWRNGYITLKGESPMAAERNLEELYSGSEIFWQDVDWSATYAYAMGLGSIYLNKAGREPEGIVREGEMAELVLHKLQEGLQSLRDPDTGASVVRSVYRGKENYSGPFASQAPDILVGFEPGYRVSWQTALGGIPEEIIEPNVRKWSGDHCSIDPAVTPGVLFSNRQVNSKTVSLLDMAPSVLQAFGCQNPQVMEGRGLWA